MKIKDFKINYKNNPVAVESSPLFSWKTDFLQTAYKIVVTQSGKIVFDTGIVKSGESLGIEYSGKKLVSDSEYDVELTAFCEKQSCTACAKFQTGLLEKSDWKGRWVNMPANFCGDALYVRHDLPDFSNKKINRAKCFVAGLGYHEFYVNGKKMSNAVLSPAFSDPSKRINYIAYDITENLNCGKNALGFILGNGWIGQKYLLVQINIYFADGEIYQGYTGGGNWWARSGAVKNNSVYGGEVYDARCEFSDWLNLEHVPCWDNGWMYLLNALNAPQGKLFSSDINDIEKCASYTVVSKNQIESGKTVYDFGQNISGWCKIKVKGERDSKITIYHAEDIITDGSVNTLNLRLATNCDVYVLKGEGIEEYEPRFTYHGFRYAQVEISGKAEVLEITAEHVHTNVDIVGNFECSNDTLNKLHKMAVITELNNLHGIMTDCPQRDERFMWLNDLSSRVFQSLNNCAMESVLPKILDDISDTVDELGRIADTAPYFTAQRPADPVCVCYLLFALCCYQRYGDKRTVLKHYDKLKGWADYLISRSHDYLMDYFYYGDWVTPYEDGVKTDNLFVSSAYLYWHIISMQKLAKICDKKEDYKYYTQISEDAKNSFNAKFFNSTYYGNDTQTENSIALSLNLVPENKRADIAKRVVDDIVAKKYHSTCGNQGYRHMFYALSDEGYTDQLIKMITNPEYPGWGYMVASGATTVWERWEKEMKCEMHSFDHPMFSAYDGWLYEYLGGIKIDEDAFGCNKVIISPKIDNSLTFVNCNIKTIRGTVASNWQKKENIIEYYIQIPNGVTAEINISGLEKTVVSHGVYTFRVDINKSKE